MAVEFHALSPERRDAADEDHSPPSHHPPAPSDEMFDVSTTVDPAYIISMIRKLLPVNNKDSSECGQGQGNSRSLVCSEDALGGVEESHSHGMDLDTSGYRDRQDENDKDVMKTNGEEDSKVREESGCVLWDLSASRTHAEFMVQNLALEVLLANLTVPNSDRVKEICIGIIGNLSCHEQSRKQIINTIGLVEVIVDQLYSDDTPCLCEVCRVITLGLQSTDSVTWAKALQSENILTRLLWIIENALNPQLIEKSVQLLLGIIESPEGASLLLPPLIQLGLPSLLIKLLSFEMDILMNERVSERYPVLEVIFSTIEALSVIDDYSLELSSSKELFQILCSLIKLPDKFEVANCSVSAAVLIANILSDTDLASDLAADLLFIQGLLDIFPFASDDLQANSALWNVLARVFVKIEESKMTLTSLCPYVSLLVSHTDYIEDGLLDHQSDASPTKLENSLKPAAKSIALNKIITILNCWTAAKDEKLNDGEDLNNDHDKSGNLVIDVENINRLLECCHKYLH